MLLCVGCFDGTVLCVYIEYHIQVNMYHVRAQGVDERMINVYYYYCLARTVFTLKQYAHLASDQCVSDSQRTKLCSVFHLT